MTIDYSFPRFRSGIRRPFVPINIINPHTGLSKKIYCLLDTGADECLFNIDIVNSLGHNLKAEGVQSKIKMGISGTNVIVWPHTFILQLLYPNVTDVAWESSSILVDCSEIPDLPNLLGTQNFLREFTFIFDYQNDLVTLKW
jgi:hypothetical protein